MKYGRDVRPESSNDKTVNVAAYSRLENGEMKSAFRPLCKYLKIYPVGGTFVRTVIGFGLIFSIFISSCLI